MFKLRLKSTILHAKYVGLCLLFLQQSSEVYSRFTLPDTPQNPFDLLQKTVTGKVTTPDEPLGLPGVTVSIKGTTEGVSTDTDGNYQLLNVPGDATLVFSMVGMEPHEEQVNNRETINVVLTPTASDLDE